MTKRKIIAGMKTLVGDQWLQDHAVVVQDQLIQEISPITAVAAQTGTFHFPTDHWLVPGFIDLHIHGVNGLDVMDGTPEALHGMGSALAAEGVTGFLATTMSANPAHMETVLQSVATAMCDPKHGAAILGVHLEGPFISPEKMGAQCAHAIAKPDVALIKNWQKLSSAAIKLVTLAPELPESPTLIQALKELGIVIAMGHTNATHAETKTAIALGCSHATHLFNAMRGVHQREPGAAGALLLSDEVSAEIIADGLHLHPAIVDLALRLKGKDKLVLVTDAMRAKCLGDGAYDLGGQMVNVSNKAARLPDGTLAGSVLRMPDAIKNIVKFTGCSLSEAIHMATQNPARVLGLSQKGVIAVGKDADLLVLNADLDVVMTMRQGEVIYRT